MSTEKKQFEVLEEVVVNKKPAKVGTIVELTAAAAKKLGGKVKAVEPKLTPGNSNSSATDADESEERLTPPSQEDGVSASGEDYLRQYQIRKGTVPGSPQSDPQPGSKAETMKTKLLTQQKVKIFIPRPQGEDKTILQSVTLNGYRLDLPKQAYLDVPFQVAQVLMESLQQTEQALAQHLIKDNKDKEDALS